MTRRFVAIGIPEQVRTALDESLADARGHWEGLRPTRADDWHLTVAFVGELADDALEQLVEVVGAGLADSALPDELALDGAGRFGRRVLWAGVCDRPEGRLAALGETIQQACAAAGLPVEQRPVHPHVTLARARRGAQVRAGHEAQAADAVASVVAHGVAAWRPEGVEVWASHLGAGPARYEVEAVVPG